MKEHNNKYLLLLLGSVCIFIVCITVCVFRFSPLLFKQSPEQQFYNNREDFTLIASFMINNSTPRISERDRDEWPEEIETALYNIMSGKDSVNGVYRDANYPDLLHFSFPRTYEGKDSENTDVWIIPELIYCKARLPSVIEAAFVTPTGIDYYTEQIEAIKGIWYMGSYRAY